MKRITTVKMGIAAAAAALLLTGCGGGDKVAPGVAPGERPAPVGTATAAPVKATPTPKVTATATDDRAAQSSGEAAAFVASALMSDCTRIHGKSKAGDVVASYVSADVYKALQTKHLLWEVSAKDAAALPTACVSNPRTSGASLTTKGGTETVTLTVTVDLLDADGETNPLSQTMVLSLVPSDSPIGWTVTGLDTSKPWIGE